MKKIFLAIICAAALYSGYVYARGAKMITTSDDTQEEVTFKPKTQGGKSDNAVKATEAYSKCLRMNYKYGPRATQCPGDKTFDTATRCPYVGKVTKKDKDGVEQKVDIDLFKECICSTKFEHSKSTCEATGAVLTGETCVDHRGTWAVGCGCENEGVSYGHFDNDSGDSECVKWCENSEGQKICVEARKCGKYKYYNTNTQRCECREITVDHDTEFCNEFCMDDAGTNECVLKTQCKDGTVPNQAENACVPPCTSTEAYCKTTCQTISHSANPSGSQEECKATGTNNAICGNFLCDTDNGQVCHTIGGDGQGTCMCNMFTKATNDVYVPEGLTFLPDETKEVNGEVISIPPSIEQHIYTKCDINQTIVVDGKEIKLYSGERIGECRINAVQTTLYSNCKPNTEVLFTCEESETTAKGIGSVRSGTAYQIIKIQNNSLNDTVTETYYRMCECKQGYTWNGKECVSNNCSEKGYLYPCAKGGYILDDRGCQTPETTWYLEGCNCDTGYWDASTKECVNIPSSANAKATTCITHINIALEGNSEKPHTVANNCYVCNPGYYREGNSCIACPIGTYKSDDDTYNEDGTFTSECTSCGGGKTTNSNGTTRQSDCVTCNIPNQDKVTIWSKEIPCKPDACQEGYMAAGNEDGTNGKCVQICDPVGCSLDTSTSKCKCEALSHYYYCEDEANCPVELLGATEECIEVSEDKTECTKTKVVARNTKDKESTGLYKDLKAKDCNVRLLKDGKVIETNAAEYYDGNGSVKAVYEGAILLGGSKYDAESEAKVIYVANNTTTVFTYAKCKPIEDNICNQEKGNNVFTSENCKSIGATANISNPYYESGNDGSLKLCSTEIYATCECSIDNQDTCQDGHTSYDTCEIGDQTLKGCQQIVGCVADTCIYDETNLTGTAKVGNLCGTKETPCTSDGNVRYSSYVCETGSMTAPACNETNKVARPSGYYTDADKNKTPVCYSCEPCKNDGIANALTIEKDCSAGQDACNCVITSCKTGFYVADATEEGGLNSCQSCEKGFSCGSDGKQECPINTYQDETGQGKCKQCPANTHTEGTKSESADACVCNDGYYKVDGSCKACATDYETWSADVTQQAFCAVPVINKGVYYQIVEGEDVLLKNITTECLEKGADGKCATVAEVGTDVTLLNNVKEGFEASNCKIALLKDGKVKETNAAEYYGENGDVKADYEGAILIGGSKLSAVTKVKKVENGVETTLEYAKCEPINDNICNQTGENVFTSENCNSIGATATLEHIYRSSDANGNLQPCLQPIYAACNCSDPSENTSSDNIDCGNGKKQYQTCFKGETTYVGCTEIIGCNAEKCPYHDGNCLGAALPALACSDGTEGGECVLEGNIRYSSYKCDDGHQSTAECSVTKQVSRLTGIITGKGDTIIGRCYQCVDCINIGDNVAPGSYERILHEGSYFCNITACKDGYYVKENDNQDDYYGDWTNYMPTWGNEEYKQSEDYLYEDMRDKNKEVAKNFCAACEPGHKCVYNPGLGNTYTGKVPCPKDTYQDETGKYECKACPTNSYTKDEGSDNIDDCICPAGMYRPDDDNKFEQNGCQPCEKGHYCPTEGTTETTMQSCQEGTYQDETNQSTCKPCGAGTYCDSTNTETPTVCGAGYYCPAPAEGATVGNVDQTACGQNNYCPEPVKGADNTQTTTLSNDVEITGNSAVISCPTGSHTKVQDETATASSLDECLNDGGYAWIAADSQTPEPCPAGTYCKEGAHLRDNITDPKLCPKGTSQLKAGQSVCELCGAKFYQDEEGQEKCKPCPAGNECPDPKNKHEGAESTDFGWGNVKPTICKAGTFQNSIGQSACIPCGTGEALNKVCPDEGIVKPIDCPEGTAPDPDTKKNDGYTNCEACHNGTYQTTENERTICKACPIGSYCPEQTGTIASESYDQFNTSTKDVETNADYITVDKGITEPISCGDEDITTTEEGGADSADLCICSPGKEYPYNEDNCNNDATPTGNSSTCKEGTEDEETWYTQCTCPGNFSQPTVSEPKTDMFRNHLYAGYKLDVEAGTSQYCFRWESCPKGTELAGTAGRYPVATDCIAKKAGQLLVINGHTSEGPVSEQFYNIEGWLRQDPQLIDCPAGYACPEGSYAILQPKTGCYSADPYYITDCWNNPDNNRCNNATFGPTDTLSDNKAGLSCILTGENIALSANATPTDLVEKPVKDGLTRCKPGTAPNANADACEPCDAGTYSDDGRKCKPCGAGTYCPDPTGQNISDEAKENIENGGNKTPTDCEAGFYCPTLAEDAIVGNIEPTPCPAGYWCPNTGMDETKLIPCNANARPTGNDYTWMVAFAGESLTGDARKEKKYYYCPAGTGSAEKPRQECPRGQDSGWGNIWSKASYVSNATSLDDYAEGVDELKDCKTPQGWYAKQYPEKISLLYCEGWSTTSTNQTGGHYCPGGVSVVPTSGDIAGRNTCPTNSATVMDKAPNWKYCQPYVAYYLSVNDTDVPTTATKCKKDNFLYANGQCGPVNITYFNNIGTYSTSSYVNIIGKIYDVSSHLAAAHNGTGYVYALTESKRIRDNSCAFWGQGLTPTSSVDKLLPDNSTYGYSLTGIINSEIDSNNFTLKGKCKNLSVSNFNYTLPKFIASKTQQIGFDTDYALWTSNTAPSDDEYKWWGTKGYVAHIASRCDWKHQVVCTYSYYPRCTEGYVLSLERPFSKACFQPTDGTTRGYNPATGASYVGVGSCPDGYYKDDVVGCKKCEAGYKCSNGSRTQCNGGKYQDSEGQSYCLTCPAGTYSPSGQPQTECSSCDQGQTSEEGSKQCSDCPKHTYGYTNDDKAYCLACDVGTYTETTGARNESECKSCDGYDTGEKCGIQFEGCYKINKDDNTVSEVRPENCQAVCKNSNYQANYSKSGGTITISCSQKPTQGGGYACASEFNNATGCEDLSKECCEASGSSAATSLSCKWCDITEGAMTNHCVSSRIPMCAYTTVTTVRDSADLNIGK